MTEAAPMAAVLPRRRLQAADLLRIDAGAAVVHQRLLRSAHAALRFGSIRPSLQPAANGPGWWLQVRLGSVPLLLQAPASLWAEWSPAHTGGAVPEALVSAGIAHAGAPLWSALAQVTESPAQLERACWLQRAPPPPGQALAWHLSAGDWRGSLHAPTAAAWSQWAAALRAPAPPPWCSDRADAWCSGALSASLPVPIALEVGRTCLPAAELSRMRRHAVLLIDALCGRPPIEGGGRGRAHTLHVLAGRRRRPVAQAQWQASGRLVRQAMSPPSSLIPVSLEGIPMSAPSDHSPGIAAPAAPNVVTERLDLGPIDVEVRFELARQHWPLAELAQWRIGESLPFEVPLAGAVVGAWVQERCIASGRLVVVGDRLGLRIDALHGAVPQGRMPYGEKLPAETPD
jgi:flagellar motor switch/type III secretory pathway protein FliN